jgi:hypothetical protein
MFPWISVKEKEERESALGALPIGVLGLVVSMEKLMVGIEMAGTVHLLWNSRVEYVGVDIFNNNK